MKNILLIEGANIWDVYQQYYADKICKENYDFLAHLDPTCKGDSKGKYLPWIISKFLNTSDGQTPLTQSQMVNLEKNKGRFNLV